MAVDSHTLTSCGGGEMGTGHGGGDDQPAVRGGDGAEAVVYKKGAWSKEEDEKLKRAVDEYGLRNWVTIEKLSGLARPAKNCRLRWLNYLRPNLKKYPFTEEEERLILHLHAKYGNSWSRIAAKLPGRSDNEIKNFWHKRAKKCQKHHLPIYPPNTVTPQDQTHTNFTISDKNESVANDDFLTHSSPQTPISISTPQSHFLSSPSSFITSQKQSPTNDQITPTSQTPVSISTPQSQFLSSPTSLITSQKQSPTSQIQLSETPLDFTTLIKPPPILSSPQSTLRRFSRSHSLVSRSSPMETKDSPMASFFTSHLQSPTTAAPPLSPLQLRLSMPVPLESTQPMTVDHFVANNNSSPALENHPSFKFCHQGVNNSSGVHEVEESDGNLDIMEELREAQERVKFLKKKLRERKISESRSLHAPLKNATKKELLKRILKRKGDMSGISQVKNPRKDEGDDLESRIVKLEKVTPGENAEILQIKEDTLSEIFERENSFTFNEQSQWIEDLLSESSSLLQESFLKGEFFGQSTETTLVNKPGYLQGEEFGYSIGHDFQDNSNLDVKSLFCEPNLIPNQYNVPHQLDSGYLLSQPTIMENGSGYLFSQQMMQKQESFPGEQFYLQQEETCPQQNLLEGSLQENLWNYESGCSQTGEVVLKEEQEQQENMDIIMPDDLSSLLEFFPANNQTLEWYNIGDAITNTESANEQLLSIADYI